MAQGPALEELLPKDLAAIAQEVGVAEAIRLAEAFGGTRLYVPREERLHEAHPIVEAIGLPAARKLARAFKTETFELPLARAYLRRIKHRAMREAFASSSASTVARRFNTTRRSVFRVAAEDGEADDAQDDLFKR